MGHADGGVVAGRAPASDEPQPRGLKGRRGEWRKATVGERRARREASAARIVVLWGLAALSCWVRRCVVVLVAARGGRLCWVGGVVAGGADVVVLVLLVLRCWCWCRCQLETGT